MTPVNVRHGEIQILLATILKRFVEERDCGIVLGEPVQLRFDDPVRRRSPNLFFVAADRADILRENHIEGAPDLIMEIVSPRSADRDRREKFTDYEDAGAREYWIIDPLERRLDAYALDPQGRFQAIPQRAGSVASTVLPGFSLRPEWLLRDPLRKTTEILRTMGID